MCLLCPVAIPGRSHAKTEVDISLRSEKIQGKGHLVLLAELKNSMVFDGPTGFLGSCGDHEIGQGTPLRRPGSRKSFFSSEGMRASKRLPLNTVFSMTITSLRSVRKIPVHFKSFSFGFCFLRSEGCSVFFCLYINIGNSAH